jgi:N-methylhydantoinase A/oxoprolinase/acetone carboxylase beta subunit
MAYIVGVDIGGTFTDAFASDENGGAFSAKSLSTPADFAVGMVNALGELADVIGLDLREFLGTVGEAVRCRHCLTTVGTDVDWVAGAIVRERTSQGG